MKFVVQSDEHWLTSFDQVVTAKCTNNVTTTIQEVAIVETSANGNLTRSLVAGPDGVAVSDSLANLNSGRMDVVREKIESRVVQPRPVLVLGQYVPFSCFFVLS